MLMASLILVPVFFGIILYKLPQRLGKVVLLGVQAYLLALAVFLFSQTENGFIHYSFLGGNSPILNIVLRGTRLSMLLIVITNLLFGVGIVYKFKDKFFDGKLMLLFLVLQGLTAGLFITDDLFNLFIFFEVSTVLTTILLMFKKEGRAVYDALYYLMTQMISMMFFLFGVGFLYRMFGVLSISVIGDLIPEAVALGRTQELVLPFTMLMSGLCFKIGLFPMHGWVSRAYGLNSAPITQVAVMSSIMMKTSLFWIFRFYNIFLPAFDFGYFFAIFAVATSIYAAIKALSQKDIRIMLAYSTVSQLGFMMAARFLGGYYSYYGSSYHIITHATFKMLLFLSAGLIIRKYETADIHEIRGVLKRIPIAGIISIIGILSITGFPFTSGSISKYFMSAGLDNLGLVIVFWIMSFATILVFVKYSTMLLPSKETKKEHIKNAKKISLIVLAATTLVLGLAMNDGINQLLDTNKYINLFDFALKAVIYIVLVASGVIIYKKFLYKRKIVYDTMEHSLSFSRMCLVLLGFFTTLLLYGMWAVN